MKQFITLFFAAFTLAAFAQVSNVQVVDCQGTNNSIYAALALGKPLLIASKGTDCSACMNKASGFGTWASNHPNVSVWAAMTKTYSSSQPSCTEVGNWKSQYGWSAVFAFVDSNKVWRDVGTPRYYVYDHRDSTLAYNGFDETAARNTALEIANATLGLQTTKSLDQTQLNIFGSDMEFSQLPDGSYEVEVFDLSGRKMFSTQASANAGEMRLQYNFKSGNIYFIRLNNKAGHTRVFKKAIVRP